MLRSVLEHHSRPACLRLDALSYGFSSLMDVGNGVVVMAKWPVTVSSCYVGAGRKGPEAAVPFFYPWHLPASLNNACEEEAWALITPVTASSRPTAVPKLNPLCYK